MDVQKVSKKIKKEQWKELIKNREASGQPISKWCEEHGIQPSSYYYWLKVLRNEQCDIALSNGIITPDAEFAEIPIIDVSNNVSNQCKGESTAIRFNLGSTTIAVTNDISPELLDRIINLIK